MEGPRTRLAEVTAAALVAGLFGLLVAFPATCMIYTARTGKTVCQGSNKLFSEALAEAGAVTAALLWARRP